MRLAEHVAGVVEIRNAYKIFVGKPEGKKHSEDLGVDGRIMFEWILGKWSGNLWTACIWLMLGTSWGLL